MRPTGSKHGRGAIRRWGSLFLAVVLFSAFVGPLPALAVWPPATGVEVEPNDSYDIATPMPVDATIMEANYATGTDWDYYSVSLVSGTTYVFETGPALDALSTNVDTYLHLYDTDGVSQITSDDDGGVQNFSRITYTAGTTGTYYIASRPYSEYWGGYDYGIRAYPQGTLAEGSATITGTVTDGTDPLEGVTVTDYGVDPWFYALDSGYSTMLESTTTAADGTYTLASGAGAHVVEFQLDGYYTQYYDGQTTWESATPVELVDDQTATGIDATMMLIPPMATNVAETVRASVDGEGSQGMDESESYRGSRTPALSADGNFVVFYSGNSFVSGDDNYERDWYLKNLETGEISLVSADSEGVVSGYTEENSSLSDGDGTAGISGDGRYVVFDSNSNTLVEGDTNYATDVFLRDTVEGTTVRVSENADGSDGTDGSESTRGSRNPAISRDGRYVVFFTGNAFVPEDTNGSQDWYRKDLETGEFELVSIATDGTQSDDTGGDEQGPGAGRAAISADGRYVAFDSWASNLAENDTNGYRDVFLRDCTDGTTVLVSAPAGTEDNGDWNYGSRTPAISADGRYVVFITGNDFVEADQNDNTTDWYRKDMTDGSLELVSVNPVGLAGEDGMWDNEGRASISDDGQMVAFSSEANDLVGGDDNDEADIFLRDIAAGETSIVSVSSDAVLSNGWQEVCSMSADGTTIAYDSWSDNLVADDTNDCADVFVGYLGERPPSEVTETPLEGVDRYATSIQVSQDAFPDGADAVVIATGENWPDALGGSALAGVLGGPVLLSKKSALPLDVADEVERLGASEAYVLGDYRALSNGVYNTLVDMLGSGNVHRIGGVNRYRTAELVAAEVVDMQSDGYDGTAFVATGGNFADALAAAPLAAANGWPVYLSGMPSISDETVAAMQDAGVTDAILLGGEAAMPEGTSIIILGAGMSAVRIDGADRYETAAKVAEFGVTDAGLSWDGVALATGEKFPDALSGGVAQGLSGSVLLLTRSTSLSPAAEDALTANAGSISEVRFLGGLPALSQAVRDAVMAIFTP